MCYMCFYCYLNQMKDVTKERGSLMTLIRLYGGWFCRLALMLQSHCCHFTSQTLTLCRWNHHLSCSWLISCTAGAFPTPTLWCFSLSDQFLNELCVGTRSCGAQLVLRAEFLSFCFWLVRKKDVRKIISS